MSSTHAERNALREDRLASVHTGEESLGDRNTVSPRPGEESTAIAINWETVPVSFSV